MTMPTPDMALTILVNMVEIGNLLTGSKILACASQHDKSFACTRMYIHKCNDAIIDMQFTAARKQIAAGLQVEQGDSDRRPHAKKGENEQKCITSTNTSLSSIPRAVV